MICRISHADRACRTRIFPALGGLRPSFCPVPCLDSESQRAQARHGWVMGQIAIRSTHDLCYLVHKVESAVDRGDVSYTQTLAMLSHVPTPTITCTHAHFRTHPNLFTQLVFKSVSHALTFRLLKSLLPRPPITHTPRVLFMEYLCTTVQN